MQMAHPPPEFCTGGTGLGLSIAKRVSICTVGGSGSNPSRARDRHANFTLCGSKPKGAIMSKRILVVEDQEDNRQILRDLLTSADFEVIEAVDGEAGLAAAAAHRPDLILMDIQL